MSLKIFSPLPGRGCVKKGLPFILTAPRTVSTSSSGLRARIAESAQKKSRILLKKFAYIMLPPWMGLCPSPLARSYPCKHGCDTRLLGSLRVAQDDEKSAQDDDAGD